MRYALLSTSLIALSTAGIAQDVPLAPPPEAATYSPYTGQDFPNQVLFGDTHLHTGFSADAGLVGAVRTPDDAYRFAKGEVVTSNQGIPARLGRPLDWLVVADHAENLGLPIAMRERNPDLLATEWGAEITEIAAPGTIDSMIASYNKWAQAVLLDGVDPLAGTDFPQSMWSRVTEAAEQHYVPGAFTSFIGFEWTSGPSGNNLHRVVVFKDGKDKADQIIPFSNYDSDDPERLWDWLQQYEESTGGEVLALAHNGNLSNGLMFDDVTLSGEPLSADYATRRARWEPIYEVTQMKGDGEAHPMLSPDDEFADFETWDTGSFGEQPKTEDMIPREYAREALKRGMAYEASLGVNPFKFGMVGSTDAHTALSTTQEDNFFGKVAALEPSNNPIRFEEGVAARYGAPENVLTAAMTSASGLAAVWARENTREAIWDAMKRREVYATTGTRLRVRVFAGYGFSAEDLPRSDFAAHGYAMGVPMGGDLAPDTEGRAPGLLIRALRDPDGANLDRVQVVKGWLNDDGTTGERVYDVVWSGDRVPDDNGKLPPVGNTVDVENATWTNDIGQAILSGYWEDPEFDPSQAAFYYVRVIEIPTPRWTVYDAKQFDVALPEGVPTAIQDRAYTSPIWYTPAN
jgi:hypothetical protein